MTDLSKEEVANIELIIPSKGDSTSSNAPMSFPESKEPPSPFNLGPLPAAKMEAPRGETAFRGRIVLNPGISTINYYASIIHTLVTFFNMTLSTALQPLILLDSNGFDVSTKQIGVVLSELILMQTLSKILLGPVYGYLMDNAGRKPMIILGAALSLMGYIMVPWFPSVFPGHALCKLLVANGANILAQVPLNADYVHDSTKGRATGITQACVSLGSLIGSVYLTVLLACHISLWSIHVITGIIAFALLMLNSIGIKGGKYFLSRDGHETAAIQNKPPESFVLQMRKGMNALSKNGWLLITLVISTLARADYYLITAVFTLYVKSFANTPEEKKDSSKMISMYQDIFFALGFFGNLAYGYILDKVNPMKIIFPALLMGTLGYVLVLFTKSAHSAFIPILIVTAGVAMPGMFNSANYLGIKNFPRDLRGVLTSILNVFGVVGYLFLSVVGGYLFDHWGRNAPFFLFDIMMILSTVLVFVIYNWMRIVAERRRKRNERMAGAVNFVEEKE